MRRISLTQALFLVLVVTVSATAHAATQASNYKSEVGISGQVITNPTTATFLTVPPGAEHAHITVEGASACYGDNLNGAAPTPTNSGRWLAGTQWLLTNDPLRLKRLRVINCTGSAATITIYYSRQRRVGDAQ